MAVGDDQVVGEHRQPPGRQRGQQAALAGLTAADHGPRQATGNKRAGVVHLAAGPAAEDGRRNSQVGVDHLVGAERRPGECRGAPAPVQQDLAVLGKVEHRLPGFDAGGFAVLLGVADVDAVRAWPPRGFRGGQAGAGDAGDVQAVDVVAGGGCHGRMPSPPA